MDMKGKVLTGSVAGLLALSSWQASALEPDADLSLVPGRGVDIVAGILDGTLDFGEAVLFAEGGLYGDEGLFEDYLRDFLITDNGLLAEHGFLGAILGGDGVAAGFTSPDGILVGTLLELSGNYEAFHGADHTSSQASSASVMGSGLGPSGLLEGGGLTGLTSLTAIPVSLIGGFTGN